MEKALVVLMLLIPTLWELYEDRKGDFNKTRDVVVRYALAILVGIIHFFWVTGKPVFDTVFLSMGINFLIFDYAIAYILIKSGKIEAPRGISYHWFFYLSHSPFDSLWYKWHPWVRFAVRVAVFGAALAIYIIEK